jgi:hypothetical protein
MSQDDIQQQIQRASEAQAKHAEELMALPHVVGVAVGYTSRGGAQQPEIGLIVMVDEKLPEAQLAPDALVPRELDGVRVDVQPMGTFTAQ